MDDKIKYVNFKKRKHIKDTIKKTENEVENLSQQIFHLKRELCISKVKHLHKLCYSLSEYDLESREGWNGFHDELHTLYDEIYDYYEFLSEEYSKDDKK